MSDIWGLGWDDAVATAVSGAAIYVTLIVFSRIVGPRSFSQMTAFDFAVTVAIGAIVGSTASGAAPFGSGLVAFGVLFGLRAAVASLRRHGLSRLVDNRPMLLMTDGRFLDENLRSTKVTRDDVLEALRLAGVTQPSAVPAVVIERNGSISVLRDEPIDPSLMRNVRGVAPQPGDAQPAQDGPDDG